MRPPIALGKAVSYESAGTVEFIYDVARDDVYFLEVNTRLQVEHPVTEDVFGVDLVEWMIRQAAGEFALPDQASLVASGAAMEVRIYAENPQADFRPSTGLLTEVRWPAGVAHRRLDRNRHGGFALLRSDARQAHRARRRSCRGSHAPAKCADGNRSLGHRDQSGLSQRHHRSEAFTTGDVSTTSLKNFAFTPRAIEVLAPGAQTSVQDWPGRLGLWDVGVPPSGPMDDRSHRLANRDRRQ